MAHVLLVEDDDAHAMIVQAAFEEDVRAGTLDRVSSGEEAVAYIQREGRYESRPDPDLILLDLKLRTMSGLDLLRLLKGHARHKSIPVVILTSSDDPRDRMLAYSLHANSYLAKPTDFDEFCRMMREVKSYWAMWNRRPVMPAPQMPAG